MTLDTYYNEEHSEQLSKDKDIWSADADRLTYGPRTELFVRRQVERRRRLEELFRSIGTSWYRIRYPNQSFSNPIDSDAHVSVEGDTVRFTWTTYWHGDSDYEFEFPLAWTWDETWEDKAYALRDEQTKAETDRYLAKAQKDAAERLQQARHDFEYAQRKASELGVHDAR